MSDQHKGKYMTKWDKGPVPIQATRALDVYVDSSLPIPREQQVAMMLMQAPPVIQGMPLGIVGECLAANFEFSVEQAQLHEAVFEAMMPCMRTYLAVAFMAPSTVENMVTVLKETGDLPPLEAMTYSLQNGVLFDDADLAKEIGESSASTIIWMSTQSKPSLTPGETNFTVSYKILTPGIIGNVDISLVNGELSIKSAVSPRTADDDFSQLPAVPVLNVDSYEDVEDESAVPQDASATQ